MKSKKLYIHFLVSKIRKVETIKSLSKHPTYNQFLRTFSSETIRKMCFFSVVSKFQQQKRYQTLLLHLILTAILIIQLFIYLLVLCYNLTLNMNKTYLIQQRKFCSTWSVVIESFYRTVCSQYFRFVVKSFISFFFLSTQSYFFEIFLNVQLQFTRRPVQL